MRDEQKGLRDFFLIVPLGFEDLAGEELEAKWQKLATFDLDQSATGNLAYSKVEGGLELQQVPLVNGCALNMVLKVPTRILLRLTSFKCRDFPKLYNKVRKFAWGSYLKGQLPRVEVSTHTSRLMHQKRIAAAVQDGLSAYYKACPPKKSYLQELEHAPPVTLYVRFCDDECIISMDTSGMPLYKRWEGKKVGRAPIRENLAAALFFLYQKEFSRDWQNILLIDPFCGAGTLLAEAKTFAITHKARDYAFLHFPCLRTQRDKCLTLHSQMLMESTLQIDCKGFDRDASCVQYAEENYSQLAISFEQRDLFSQVELKGSENQQVICVLTNPPYGKRILVEKALKGTYQAFLRQIIKTWSPHLIGLIVPNTIRANEIVSCVPYKTRLVHKFRNGGMNVSFVMLARDSKSESL